MMKRAMMAAALSAAVLLGWGAAPAQAATITKNTVVIQESVGGEWDTAIRQAAKFLDRYTGKTRMVVGKCTQRAQRCITVRYGTPSRKAWVGECGPSCGPSRDVSRIVVRKSWAGSGPVAAKKRLLTHELAHAFGLSHNPRFTSVMYGWVYRDWVLSPYTFTAAERRKLARV